MGEPSWRLRCISLLGFAVMLLLAWLMSSARRKVPWRIVIFGTLLQFGLAVVVLQTRPGKRLFQWIGDGFDLLLSFSDRGAEFVFPGFPDSHFAFRVLPTIVFVSALMSLLYHWGVMQWVVKCFAWVMMRTLRTSGAETLAASANVFLGQTEAPLLVRPFLGAMTKSELNAVMVGGFATIAGGVMAAYRKMGVDVGHLVTASVISAPAGLVIAKLLVPETESPATRGDLDILVPRSAQNALEAVAIGAAEGVKLAINVAAMLLAFTALIYLCNALFGWAGSWFGWNWTLEGLFGYAFAPLAWLIGIPAADCLQAGELLGIKMVLNEFVAYDRLMQITQTEGALSDRSVVLLTYALCGFSNFASIGIQIGGLSAMAPDRRPDLAQLALRAMLGGTLACCMTACLVGFIA